MPKGDPRNHLSNRRPLTSAAPGACETEWCDRSKELVYHPASHGPSDPVEGACDRFIVGAVTDQLGDKGTVGEGKQFGILGENCDWIVDGGGYNLFTLLPGLLADRFELIH